MAIQMTRAHRDAIHDALFVALAELDPAATYLGVGKALVDKGLDTTITDITEGTGVGFGRQKVVTWGKAHDMVDDRRVTDGPLLSYTATAPGDAMAVNCWFLADAAAAGNLMRWGTIVPPVQINGPEDSMSVVARIFTDPAGNVTGEVIING